MSKNTSVVGFPRIGEQRELKKVLENFWSKKCDFNEVITIASTLKEKHWRYQKDAGIEYISSNDFSLYEKSVKEEESRRYAMQKDIYSTLMKMPKI